MRLVTKTYALASPLVASLLFALPAGAATWYVSPAGTVTSGCSTRDAPCSLGAAASGAVAGDTVVLTDGVYKTSLFVANSGTADAWITFKADECSTPILEGPGSGPEEDEQSTGVGSTTGQYLRFEGIVSRGWNIGFGNAWTGNVAQDSNGNWEIRHCIGDMNGRTGFTFFSAGGFKLKHSISAHNGSSSVHSWSSGVTLYASPAGELEGNVSFENMDNQNHTDGSGFIADEASNGASFVNNIAFNNGGSCLRLTRSSNVKFVNNTCYHDARDPMATGPTDPDEVYFSNAPSDMSTITDIWFANNALVALGSGAGPKTENYTPSTGWMNNASALGMVTQFNGPDADSPDFTLSASATQLIGKGTTQNSPPTEDIGFDPKCIVKRAPTMIGNMAKGGWWEHSIDYDYIKSIGGVARCFNPKARSGALDIGAYANGPVTTAMQNTCTPPPVGTGTGAGGSDNSGGSATTGGNGTTAGVGTGGGVSSSGSAAGGAANGGSTAAGGGDTAPPAGTAESDSGCGCRMATGARGSASLFGLVLLGSSWLGLRRLRHGRSAKTSRIGSTR